MSENEKDAGGPEAPEAPKEKKRPSYEAKRATKDDSGKTTWEKTGVAFEHRDGRGHTILREGEEPIILRKPYDRLMAAKERPPQQRKEQEGQER